MRRRSFLAAIVAAPFAGAASAHPAPSALAPRIARRYRIALPAAEYVAGLAGAYFPEDPALMLALIGVESSFRVWSLGRVDEIGLCQVRPDMHGASAEELIGPEANIRTAARVLRAGIQRSGGDVERGLARYNGAGEAARRYAKRVLSEKRRLCRPCD